MDCISGSGENAWNWCAWSGHFRRYAIQYSDLRNDLASNGHCNTDCIFSNTKSKACSFRLAKCNWNGYCLAQWANWCYTRFSWSVSSTIFNHAISVLIDFKLDRTYSNACITNKWLKYNFRSSFIGDCNVTCTWLVL